MSDFNYAIDVILTHEGGLSDNPHDPGGITNFGITIGFLNDRDRCSRYFGHPGPATRDDIRFMSRDLAFKIYLDEIWTPNRYSEIADNRMATKIFDCTVNMGEKWGESFAQQAANRLGQNIAVDGQIGSKSIAAINLCDPNAFLKEYCQQMRERYEGLVLHNPNLAVFLKGWLARARWPFPPS